MSLRQTTASAVVLAAALALASCSSSPSAAGAQSETIVGNGTPTASTTHSATKPSPSASTCTLPDNQDLIVRDDDPGASVIASEIGEVDIEYCTSSLTDFQQTAGQAAGECTTIAWAKDNPGYDVNAVPAPPLKHVIESAGPGC